LIGFGLFSDIEGNPGWPNTADTIHRWSNRMEPSRRILLGALSALGATAFWPGDSAGAPSASADALLAANAAFDAALSRLDIGAVDALSLHEAHAMAIHPAAREITRGPEAVRKSWEAVADRFAQLSVRLDDPQAVALDNVGWVSGTEVVTGKRKTGETVSYTALTTNVFEKRDGRWLVSAHLTARLAP
jgi:ketosteroid isomerase-like protein